jgi:hypothetical protein
MYDRYFALPANPSLEYYRKQAKALQRAFAAGDQEAAARVAEILGDRAAERFQLSDAQFVLAQEHGFRSWAEFRIQIERRSGTADRPVARLLALPATFFESQADTLLAELRRNDSTALERLRTQVPRHANAPDASAVDLRDARLILARELGFLTWLDLLSYAEKARQDNADRRRRIKQLGPELQALRDGDTERLTRLSPAQADDLLYALAGPEAGPGEQLGKELGAPRAAVAVLIEKATNLDAPLAQAATHDRVEYIRMLLDAGANPRSRHGAHTPLEHAIYFGSTEVVDLIAERDISPSTVWTYAACGRLDLVQSCFDDGALRPETAIPRPDPMLVPGFPPRLLGDDPEELLAEAFAHACQHGRTEVVRWLLDHGVSPNARYYLGRTGLHWAIPGSHVEVVRLLLERGADPSLRDDMFKVDADGLLHIALVNRPHHPTTEQLHDLIEAHGGQQPPPS